jgi:hypothetical protein
LEDKIRLFDSSLVSTPPPYEKLRVIMEQSEILNGIGLAGSWLPKTLVRQALEQREGLMPIFLEVVQARACATSPLEVRHSRLATFGVFFLAQYRDRRLFDPLLRLFEKLDPYEQDEWLFANRVFYYGHRLLAGICPLDGERSWRVALDATPRPETRSVAIGAVGLSAVYGDSSRAETIARLRALFAPVQKLNEELTTSTWGRTAAKLHCREFERELQWLLASGRLDRGSREDIAGALRQNPDVLFISAQHFESPVDLFTNVFRQEFRNSEPGLLPNGELPGLELHQDPEPNLRGN